MLPLHNHMKQRCSELYEPLPELSIDERMVKSKARSHFRQYIRNKPIKWGFKYWFVSDPTGYTLDFDLYWGKNRTQPVSPYGLTYIAVMELVKPFHLYYGQRLHQPYPCKQAVITCKRSSGTLTTTRKDAPSEVAQMKMAMK